MGLSFVSFTYSSKDVPGKWSLVVFLPFCNFRCRHCHNWRLVRGEERCDLTEERILYEISKNPFIDTIVISGGEPTVHKVEELKGFVLRVKENSPSLKVRIDTNGSKPEVVKELKEVVDGFAVDIKSPIGRADLYRYTTNSNVDPEKVLESMEIADGMPLTIYRTPWYPWLTKEEVEEIRDLTDKFSSPWFLNEFFEVPECPFNR